jgi:hypothetical protein
VIRLLPLLALLACVHPSPPATTTDAGVSDLFTAYLTTAKFHAFNCALPVVAVERDAARGDITTCLLKGAAEDVEACTVKQATSNYDKVSVACGVRDIGAQRNAAYLAGNQDPADKAAADAARQWIHDHWAAYVSVEVSP